MDTVSMQANESLKKGEFCYVLNSRQMGKSSLRVRTMQRLQNDGIICAFIDLTGIGKEDVTAEKWYAGFVQSLVRSCKLEKKINWRQWWRENRDMHTPLQLLSMFIRDILLVEIEQNIVIFVDEIDRVLSQNFSLDDFFELIRYCSEQQPVDAKYQRLTFALLGVATPYNLVKDKKRTPFNIGTAIELYGFQEEELQPLLKGLEGKVDNPHSMLKKILDWTGGQPFLTQKLCKLVVTSADNFIRNEKEEEVWLAQLVQSHIIENWESQDEPEHLRTIRDRILGRGDKTTDLLEIYQEILQQSEIKADENNKQMELRLSGLVVKQQGKLKIYNRLYEFIFNQDWVNKGLKEHDRAIADYSQAIKLDPNDVDSYYNRGNAYSDLKEYDRTIADHNQALKLDPNFADAHHNRRGNVYYDLKVYDRAIADYNQALKLDPNFVKAYYNRGLAYKNKGNKDLAIKDFKKIIEFNNNKGLIQFAQ